MSLRHFGFLLAAVGCAGAPQRATTPPSAEPEIVSNHEAPLAVATNAPEFSLRDAAGGSCSLSKLRANGPVVILFYQGAWCAGCREQLVRFQRAYKSIREAGAAVVAIGADGAANAERLAETLALDFPVLLDSDLGATHAFGVTQAIGELPIAAVFVVDRDGKIAFSRTGEPIDADSVLDALEDLAGGARRHQMTAEPPGGSRATPGILAP